MASPPPDACWSAAWSTPPRRTRFEPPRPSAAPIDTDDRRDRSKREWSKPPSSSDSSFSNESRAALRSSAEPLSLSSAEASLHSASSSRTSSPSEPATARRRRLRGARSSSESATARRRRPRARSSLSESEAAAARTCSSACSRRASAASDASTDSSSSRNDKGADALLPRFEISGWWFLRRRRSRRGGGDGDAIDDDAADRRGRGESAVRSTTSRGGARGDCVSWRCRSQSTSKGWSGSSPAVERAKGVDGERAQLAWAARRQDAWPHRMAFPRPQTSHCTEARSGPTSRSSAHIASSTSSSGVHRTQHTWAQPLRPTRFRPLPCVPQRPHFGSACAARDPRRPLWQGSQNHRCGGAPRTP